jgi:hypothetical protein
VVLLLTEEIDSKTDERGGGWGSDANFNLLFRLNRSVGAESFVRAGPHTCLELQYVTF